MIPGNWACSGTKSRKSASNTPITYINAPPRMRCDGSDKELIKDGGYIGAYFIMYYRLFCSVGGLDYELEEILGGER